MIQWSAMSKAERVERVAALMAEGYTAGRIAVLLGATRNAICGFADREGIKREKRISTTAPASSVLAPAPIPRPKRQSTSLTILELRDTTCRFPLWAHDDRPRWESSLYCGAACAPGDRYCTRCLRLTESTRHAPSG